MTDAKGWGEEYAKLRGYVAAHPEIVLTKTEISIPQPVREGFYRIFDEVRKAVAAAHLDALPLKARTLSERYARVEKEAAALLGVERIGMPIDLDVFLHDPEAGLVRPVYTPLFDLLQGKMSEGEFALQAGANIAAAAQELFRLGYERWAGLELVKALEPEESFFVDLDEDFKPYLRELETVSFGKQSHHPTMRIPEFVVRSRRFQKLVAVKMALAVEIDEYYVPFKPAVKPKKRTGDTSFALDSRAVLLSFLEDEKKIPVYADIFECTRTPPDWLVEYAVGDPEALSGALGRLSRHLEILGPKMGGRLIVLGDAPDLPGLAAALPDGVELLAPDFDAGRLEAALPAGLA
ncbi:MAG: hypothetical protein LBT74_08495 [Acidobacteriota bacterium]|jgi:hypothetical protein|nr:hypothetical protein [Acidobacteriota bacterium]